MAQNLPQRVLELINDMNRVEEEAHHQMDQLIQQRLQHPGVGHIDQQIEQQEDRLHQINTSQRYQVLRKIRDENRLPGAYTFARNLLNKMKRERATLGLPFHNRTYVIAGEVPDLNNLGIEQPLELSRGNEEPTPNNLRTLVHFIIERGGSVSKKVQRGNRALLIGENPNHTKVAMARRFNVRELNILDFVRNNNHP